MNEHNVGVTLESLAEQLTALTDLFRRRLLDDRAKQATIEDLQVKLERAERERAAESLRPLATRVSLVIERLQSMLPSTELNNSIIEELDDILETFGIRSFGLGQEVDPRRHEIVSVSGNGPVLRANELIRAGYEKDGVVLLPARITAVRVAVAHMPDGAAGSAE